MNCDLEKICGCKGIRSCLMCEVGYKEPEEEKKNIIKYIYCPYCNLCWPEDISEKETETPLYLGCLKLFPDFISEEEENFLISSIDQVHWLPSQSGRKKQDFGPKVNFKKKKAKVGDFSGLPSFSKTILERFQQYQELSDFYPVELCHLDYSPNRGSAIEPHVDDTWIWGERLVTINLASSTILTISPANLDTCQCLDESKILFGPKEMKMNFACAHKLPRFQSSASGTKVVRDMCSVYRKIPVREDEKGVEIQVQLPARSLFILSGCSRHNWFHGIKRQDISARRLAMTFRELAKDFLEGGSEKVLGDKLLELGKKFNDLWHVHFNNDAGNSGERF